MTTIKHSNKLYTVNFRGSLRGFTVIEVLIVLSIAGLILGIVFLAIPSLQRNARNNSRNIIASRIKSEMETYAANHQGLYPLAPNTPGCSSNPIPEGLWCDFYTNYISGKVNVADPSTGTDVISGSPDYQNPCIVGQFTGFRICALTGGTWLPNHAGDFLIAFGAKCDPSGVVASGSSTTTTRSLAVVIGLEPNGRRYCIDNT